MPEALLTAIDAERILANDRGEDVERSARERDG
jgi:hypothetical protein